MVKPPGDSFSPQTRSSVRRRTSGRRPGAKRAQWLSGWERQGHLPWRPRTAPPACGGSRHHALRRGCDGGGSDKLLHPTALCTQQQRPLLPLPPSHAYSAWALCTTAGDSPLSTLSGRSSNFDSSRGFRIRLLLGNRTLESGLS